jgi:hypothetical protein
MNRFEKTASAIVYSLVSERFEMGGRAKNNTVRFVLRQHARMPGFLRIPLAMLTVLFDIACVVCCGSFFHNLPPQKRLGIIKRLRKAPIAALRDFVRFYESMVVVYCYWHFAERAHSHNPDHTGQTPRRFAEVKASSAGASPEVPATCRS